MQLVCQPCGTKEPYDPPAHLKERSGPYAKNSKERSYLKNQSRLAVNNYLKCGTCRTLRLIADVPCSICKVPVTTSARDCYRGSHYYLNTYFPDIACTSCAEARHYIRNYPHGPEPSYGIYDGLSVTVSYLVEEGHHSGYCSDPEDESTTSSYEKRVYKVPKNIELDAKYMVSVATTVTPVQLEKAVNVFYKLGGVGQEFCSRCGTTYTVSDYWVNQDEEKEEPGTIQKEVKVVVI